MACSFSGQAWALGSLFFPFQKEQACNKEKYRTCRCLFINVCCGGMVKFPHTQISLFSVYFCVAAFHFIGISCMLWTKQSRYFREFREKCCLFVFNDTNKSLKLNIVSKNDSKAEQGCLDYHGLLCIFQVVKNRLITIKSGFNLFWTCVYQTHPL